MGKKQKKKNKKTSDLVNAVIHRLWTVSFSNHGHDVFAKLILKNWNHKSFHWDLNYIVSNIKAIYCRKILQKDTFKGCLGSELSYVHTTAEKHIWLVAPPSMCTWCIAMVLHRLLRRAPLRSPHRKFKFVELWPCDALSFISPANGCGAVLMLKMEEKVIRLTSFASPDWQHVCFNLKLSALCPAKCKLSLHNWCAPLFDRPAAKRVGFVNHTLIHARIIIQVHRLWVIL